MTAHRTMTTIAILLLSTPTLGAEYDQATIPRNQQRPLVVPTVTIHADTAGIADEANSVAGEDVIAESCPGGYTDVIVNDRQFTSRTGCQGSSTQPFNCFICVCATTHTTGPITHGLFSPSVDCVRIAEHRYVRHRHCTLQRHPDCTP